MNEGVLFLDDNVPVEDEIPDLLTRNADFRKDEADITAITEVETINEGKTVQVVT